MKSVNDSSQPKNRDHMLGMPSYCVYCTKIYACLDESNDLLSVNRCR